MEKSYTAQQLSVMDIQPGATVVIAGAGSGKTETIAEMIARDIGSGRKPDKVLCITFANIAAKEMQERIEKKLGYAPEKLCVQTFNAFCFDIVKEHWSDLGYQKELNVIDDVQKLSIALNIIKKQGIKGMGGQAMRQFTPGGFEQSFLEIVIDIFDTIAANDGQQPSVNKWDIPANVYTQVVAMSTTYFAMLKTKGLVTFDDQMHLALKVIEDNPDYLEKNRAFELIVVDEFQDTNIEQMELLKHLCDTSTFKSLVVVGDSFQAIYRFRGAKPENITNFSEQFNSEYKRMTGSIVQLPPRTAIPVREIVMDRNFRSTQQILDAAGNLMAQTPGADEKHLVAARGAGEKVKGRVFEKAAEEAEWIARQIASDIQHGERPEDILVMSYTKDELMRIADALTKAGIPSVLGAPEPLRDNSRVKSILAMARYLQDGALMDALMVAEALAKGELEALDFGEQTKLVLEVKEMREQIQAAADIQKKKLLMEFLDKIQDDDEAVEYFKAAFATLDYKECLEYCRDFSFLGGSQLFRRTHRYPGVYLNTTHGMKGGELKNVYLSLSKFGYDTEFLCLAYVGMTRARDRLTLSGVTKCGSKRSGTLRVNYMLQSALDASNVKYAYDAFDEE